MYQEEGSQKRKIIRLISGVEVKWHNIETSKAQSPHSKKNIIEIYIPLPSYNIPYFILPVKGDKIILVPSTGEIRWDKQAGVKDI